MKLLINLLLLFTVFSSISHAHSKPFCAKRQSNQQLIIGYLGADSSWSLKNTDEAKLMEQLAKVSLINYSFIRLAKDTNGNTILGPSAQDIENIQLLHQMKPDLPIMIAVGGWGERDGFTDFLVNNEKRAIFIQSVKAFIEQHELDGLDVDWENELLADEQEVVGVASLFRELHDTLAKDGYCITNAVPGTEAYWTNYPDASLWRNDVNWTTVMAYDHYGTFGPRTELGSALYEPNRKNDERYPYPYPNTSGHVAISHYFDQGLAAHKIILGLPFYCHSYYINNAMITANSDAPGLHVPVLDPNISSQMSYNDAYNTYDDGLYTSALKLGNNGFRAISFYGLIPIGQTDINRFMSCEGPQSILDKIAYVEGKNPLGNALRKSIKLGGVSFWSLQQDLPVSHPYSLLRAIHEGFRTAPGRTKIVPTTHKY